MECFGRFGSARKDRIVQEQQANLLKGAMTVGNGAPLYLNKGQDDEMEIWCYRRNLKKLCLTYLFTVLTAGVLRLLFHWIPHWYVYATCNLCDIHQGHTILVKEIFNGKHIIYHVKDLKQLTIDNVRQEMSKIDEKNFLNGAIKQFEEDEDIINLSVHFGNGDFRKLEQLWLFTCKKVTYIWDTNRREFHKLNGLDQNISTSNLHQIKGLTSSEQFTRRLVYGSNKIDVKQLSIATLLFLEVLNPFYIFQIASFILWFLDDYYYYAAAIIAMSVFGISMSVRQTRKNQHKLKSTVHSSDICIVQRKNTTAGDFESESISTEFLVPGDVLVIPAHGCIMHCDAILLTGNCILNESMLTGESVPVTKTALPNLPELIYDPKEHARHTLFCGTQVIQTRYFGDEKVLAVVVRTGFSTAKGSLVRSILYPPPVDFRFEKDSYRFIILLTCVAFIGCVYTIVTKVMRNVSMRDLVIEALDLITIVVPPALPAAMTVGRFYAQIRLKKQQVFCISPRTINVSGSIDCVCFDKTGTLTEDGLDLLAVVPIKDQRFLMPQKHIDQINHNKFLAGLVSCHSLTIIDNKIVGDPLDLKMFESTKWIMEEHDIDDNSKFNMIFPTVLKPPSSNKDSNHTEIGIIREFPFSSSSQRMGVIIRKLNGTSFEYYAKGSPEMILNFVRKDSVPADFHRVLESYATEGYRVIALAHKELKLSYPKAVKVQREAIEVDLELLGLIVLENRLKPDTTPCIQMLNDAEIRVIMVTGDNILTALSVAKDCDIIKPNQSVITVDCDASQPKPQLYYTLTNTKNMRNGNDASIMSNSASIVSMETMESQLNSGMMVMNGGGGGKRPNDLYGLNNYRFAMTGKVWSCLREFYPELMAKFVTRGNVFARMAPDQKQQLVQELQELGYCVAMCGDGANDCGALKAAHTGISLSEAESSVASPFTSKNANIQCVLDVIKEGRAALVTSFGIFKYMAAYSLCQFISVCILYSIESNLTDFEFLYIDLFIISIFAFFFGKTEAYSRKLVKETPLSSLMNVSPILSLFLHLALVVAMQVGAFEYLRAQNWYVPFQHDGKEKDDVGCVENFTIFTISSFQYIILAIVFSKGKPYRKSIFSNYGFIISTILMIVFSVYLTLWPSQFLLNSFNLVLPPAAHRDFSFILLSIALVNFLVSLFIELVIIDYFVFKKLRFKFHNLDKSKRKYLAIERDLQRETKWPKLSSEYRSAASPLTDNGTATQHAEIVIEKERFDKNHVLNRLYNNEEASTGGSSGDTFKSFGSGGSSYDMANSHVNLPDLPYDGGEVVAVVGMLTPPVSGGGGGGGVSSSSSNLSSFNSFGQSPKRVFELGEGGMGKMGGLEMNYLDR